MSNKWMSCAIAVMVLALVPRVSVAQVSKSVTGKMITAKATIESIERSSREVTLKKDDGTYDVLTVPESVKRFDSLKIGDTVTARYYENVVLRLKRPGEPDADTAAAAATPTAGAKPTGTLAKQRTITATITELDPKVPSIAFTGPNGWRYSTRVQDKKALAKVKVGDKVDITWTQAQVVSFDDK